MQGFGVKLGSWSKHPLLVKWCGHASVFHMWVKCEPSHITKCCYKRKLYNSEHYIHDIFNLRYTEVLMFNKLVLLKKTNGHNHHVNIRYRFVVYKPIVRHNKGTMVNFEPNSNCQCYLSLFVREWRISFQQYVDNSSKTCWKKDETNL